LSSCKERHGRKREGVMEKEESIGMQKLDSDFSKVMLLLRKAAEVADWGGKKDYQEIAELTAA